MPSGQSGAVLAKHLRALYDAGVAGALGDGPLLERFVSRRDESGEIAFAALIERHGPMVFRVCRSILRDPHDAEDASQAVFLVLACRARAIRNRDSVASWLFGVACRVSARAKRDAARRRARERQGAELAAGRNTEDRGWSEAREALYHELQRLPETCRAAVVLCDLEGLTHEQAAEHLRASVRTVQRRLEEGRRRLRDRLDPRGAVAPLASGIMPPEIVSMSTARAGALARASARFAADRGAAGAGVVPVSVATLARGVLRTMSLESSLKMTAVAAISACTVAGVLASGSWAWSADPAVVAPTRSMALAPPAPADAMPRELAHDDGKAAGKKSIAGSGHAVRFEAPGEDWTLTAVRLHGARYGNPQAPVENFMVSLCDDDFKPIATFLLPYSTFKRGPSDWVTMPVTPTKVPRKFIVSAVFNPAQTKGVYVSHDAEASAGGRSLTGLPNYKSSPFAQGDWLIRARVEPPKAAAPASGR